MPTEQFAKVTATQIMNFNNKELEVLLYKIKSISDKTNKTPHDIVDELNLP